MAIQQPTAAEIKPLDKQVLKQMMDEIHARMGIVNVPVLSAEEVRAMMIADGIRPEDNEFSTEIIQSKYAGDGVSRQ